jgi:lycopene cyclase domain-containing protein
MQLLRSSKNIITAALILWGLPILWLIILTVNTHFDFDTEAAKVVNKTSWQFDFGETKWWYVLINLGAFFFPFVLSFDKKVHFYKKWRFLFPAILLVGAFFIIWDVWFTEIGVWGFNDRYFNYPILGLPLGEWLFFFVVPYCCVFVHECLLCYFKQDPLKKYDRTISIILFSLFLLVGLINIEKAYTAWTFLLTAGFLGFHYYVFPNTYRTRFYIAYLICLIPFMLVNGILTGAFNEEPVVIYNNAHNLQGLFGFRFITIPFDDIFYGFLLVFMNVTLYEWWKAKYRLRLTKKGSQN